MRLNRYGLPDRWGFAAPNHPERGPLGPWDDGFRVMVAAIWHNWNGLLFPRAILRIDAIVLGRYAGALRVELTEMESVTPATRFDLRPLTIPSSVAIVDQTKYPAATYWEIPSRG